MIKGKLVFWAPKDTLLSTLHADPWKKLFFEHVYLNIKLQEIFPIVQIFVVFTNYAYSSTLYIVNHETNTWHLKPRLEEQCLLRLSKVAAW